MNTTPMLPRTRSLFLLLIGGAALLASATAALSKTAGEIDASVNAALKRLTAEVKWSENFVKNAKGILVMPEVKKGGFVIGGEFGRGALRVKGKTVSYYKLAAGSVGLQAGAEKKDIILVFMTDEALKAFQTSKGWEAGVDGSVAIVKHGTADSMSTQTKNKPVIGFIVGVKGIIGDVSVKGTKFTQYVPKN